jgi:hypothetical protein
MEEDGEFSPEQIDVWRQEVSRMRRLLFGSMSLPSLGSPVTEPTRTEITGYLDDVFEDWRGAGKRSPGG